MTNDKWAKYGAATGVLAVVLYVVGTLVMPEAPDFDAPAGEVSAYFHDHQSAIQLGIAFYAAAAAVFIWFAGTLVSALRRSDVNPRLATIAFGAAITATATFLVSLTAEGVAALRADTGVLGDQVTQALWDFGHLGAAASSLAFAAFFTAIAFLILRRGGLPDWLGWLAALTAIAVALGIGGLFADDGAFSTDGLLGYWVGVVAFLAWIAIASVLLYQELNKDGGGGVVSGAVDRVRGATGT